MNVCRWILKTGVTALIAILSLGVFRAKDWSNELFSDLVVYGQTTSSTNTVSDNRSTSHIFAQVADGQLGDGSSYRSTLVVQSDNSANVSCTATLVGLTIPGFGDGQNLLIRLSASRIAVVDTPGTQTIKTGYMTLACSSAVTAQVLYSLRSSSGVVLSEATVFSSPPVTTAQLFADQRSGSQLGIAVANNSNASKNLQIVASDVSGTEVGRTTLSVSSKSQLAAFLSDLLKVPENFLGTVRISEAGGNTADVYAVGLKYTGNAFTTIPVTSRTSTVNSNNPLPLTDNRSMNHVFAQVADGLFADGSGYRSTLVVQSDTSAAVTCTATLGGGLTIPGFGDGQSLSINLPAGGVAVVDTPGTQALKTGYMTLSCSSAVTAQVLYSLRSSSGNVVSESTVFSSPPATTAQLFVDQRNGSQLGIAVANNSSSSKGLAIIATDINLIGGGITSVPIGGKSQVAGFLSEFMTLPASFLGTVSISVGDGSTADTYAIGLKYTRNAFTTIPATSLGSSPTSTVPPSTQSPTVTAIIANSGTAGSSVNVTITGTNFVSGMSVSAENDITVSNVSVSSSTTATVTFALSANAIAGPRNVTVITLAGTSNALTFTINPRPSAVLTIKTVVGSYPAGFGGDGGPAASALIRGPMGVAVDMVGNLFFADTFNARIRKVTADGVISTVAGTGSVVFNGDSQPATSASLNTPHGIAVDASGNLFIADYFDYRVRKVTVDGIISTVAGTGVSGYSGDGGPAITAELNTPDGIAADGAGNLFIADSHNNRIRKVTADGTISTVAGTGDLGYSGDGGPAISAKLGLPSGVAVDAAGDLFIADTYNNRIRRVSPDGVISTVAGTGASGSTGISRYSGDGGPATSAQLSQPFGVAVDSTGNLFIADRLNHALRMVTASGIITTVAGTGAAGFSGDGGLAAAAKLSTPASVAVDLSGNLFIADTDNNDVREVFSTASPILIPVTLTSISPSSGFTGSAVNVAFVGMNFEAGMTVSAGPDITVSNLSVSSTTTATATFNIGLTPSLGSRNVSVTTSSGTSNAIPFTVTLAPIPMLASIVPSFGNAGSVLNVTLTGSNFVTGLSVSAGSDIMVSNVSISSLTTATATFTISSTAIFGPRDVTVRTPLPPGTDCHGVCGTLVSGPVTFTIDQPNATLPAIKTVAGVGYLTMGAGFAGDGGLATSAQLNGPVNVAPDAAGNMFIADTNNNRIRKVTAAGVISTVAGTGAPAFGGDGGPAMSAQLRFPGGIAVDAAGNLYIADTFNHRIRKITAAGVISTIAGNGTAGFGGDGGPATLAQLNDPHGIAVDSAGNLFVADAGNHRIREVTAAGVISTVAGNGNSGFFGDGGPATLAQLNVPFNIALDAAGNLFIADAFNHRIRKVTAAGLISTVAGTGNPGFFGDGGPATSAYLFRPDGIAVDAAGNLYIADTFNHRIRKVTAAGVISTFAGTGTAGFSGDGGPAPLAQFYYPIGIAADASGNLFVADWFNHRIREVTPPK
jgi:sugar lactone lactonase YvrE